MHQCQVLKTFYSGYGDLTRLQDELVHRGNVALKDYPLIDRIKRCYVGQQKRQEVDTAKKPLAIYARAVALEPKDASLHNDYGVALGQHGRWAEAGEWFQAALALREEQLASMLAAGNTPDERLDKLRRKVQRVKQNLQYAQQGVLASRAEL